MDIVEISRSRLAELEQRESDCYAYRRIFKNLDKTQQELLTKINEYEKVLKTIAWSSDVNPLAALHAAKARGVLYKRSETNDKMRT